MTNTGHANSVDYLTAHEVQPGCFLARIHVFEEQYRTEYPGGWREFQVAYSLDLADQENLDFDEWAFLCEHFAQELTQPSPPGVFTDVQEKPEFNSGFSFGGMVRCSTRQITSKAWSA